MRFAAKHLAIVTPLAAVVDWYDLPIRASQAVCWALYTQPDAKIANGVYWLQFWLKMATTIKNVL